MDSSNWFNLAMVLLMSVIILVNDRRMRTHQAWWKEIEEGLEDAIDLAEAKRVLEEEGDA